MNSALNDADRPDNPVSFVPSKRKHPTESTEENQNESGEGNNSDNSSGGIMSIGNNSFGFNFDNEEALGGRTSNNEDDNSDDRKSDSTHFSATFKTKSAAAKMTNESRTATGLSSLTNSSTANLSTIDQIENVDFNTTVSLSSKATARLPSDTPTEENRKRKIPHYAKDDLSGCLATAASRCVQTRTDMYDCGIDDSGGYSDNESTTTNGNHDCVDEFSKTGGNHRKKKNLDSNKREERNQREKERSFRISKQITELRELLSNGGVVVPKGTKSSVLTEAANYIRLLQQHQYRSEM
jgi:Helix-loop-helix DNA-binding domain